jgi:hypothetical protein
MPNSTILALALVAAIFAGLVAVKVNAAIVKAGQVVAEATHHG